MARAVSAQERKISRLEAKNAEQDLKIDQLSETIRHQQDVLQAWQASQKRILTTSLADLEERIARQEAKNAELDSFMNGIKQDCNLTSEKTPTGGKSYNAMGTSVPVLMSNIFPRECPVLIIFSMAGALDKNSCCSSDKRILFP